MVLRSLIIFKIPSLCGLKFSVVLVISRLLTERASIIPWKSNIPKSINNNSERIILCENSAGGSWTFPVTYNIQPPKGRKCVREHRLEDYLWEKCQVFVGLLTALRRSQWFVEKNCCPVQINYIYNSKYFSFRSRLKLLTPPQKCALHFNIIHIIRTNAWNWIITRLEHHNNINIAVNHVTCPRK